MAACARRSPRSQDTHQRLSQHPGKLLSCPAAVTQDRRAGQSYGEEELYSSAKQFNITMFARNKTPRHALPQLPSEMTPPSARLRPLDRLFATPRPRAGSGSRPGFVDLVRDVRRRSLRRRKLWMNNDTDIVSLDQNKNHGLHTPSRKFSTTCVTPKSFGNKDKGEPSLDLGSYKKLSSPVFPDLDSPQTPDTSFSTSASQKENINPIRIDKKQRRSSLFTPTSIRLR